MSTFEAFVNEQGTALLRFTCLLTNDHYAGQDLAQMTMTQAYLKWSVVKTVKHQQAYLRKIALNAHIDAGRRRSANEQPYYFSDLSDAGAAHLLGDNSAPGADAPILERDALRTLVDALPQRAREILVLRYYADFGDETIATALGISPSTVRATASRALATLRQGALVDAPLPQRGNVP